MAMRQPRFTPGAVNVERLNFACSEHHNLDAEISPALIEYPKAVSAIF
jgi:hypothetical protein